jgi:dihydroflavonol-4-reductase
LLKVDENTPIKALFRNENAKLQTQSFFAKKGQHALFNKIDWVFADVLDVTTLADAFQNVKQVFHCAGFISFNPTDEEKLRKINIEGTANIVNFCLDFQIQKLCFVSSIAALGDLLPHENIINESCDWNPEIAHSDYAISKFGAEMEIWRGQQEGLNVLVVNPGVILGEAISKKQWQNGSASIFFKIKKGLPFYTEGVTGFVGVGDVVNIMIQLMNSEIVNEKFILVTENVSYKNLCFMIANEFKVSPPKWCAKKWMTAIVWRLDWIQSKIFKKPRILSKVMAKSLHSMDFYDNSKIKNILQYEFTPLFDVSKQIVDDFDFD